MWWSLLHSPVASSLSGPKSSSAPRSQTPSAYVSPSVWGTKFHTHTKQQATLQFCISLYFWIANWKTKDSAPNDSKHSPNSVCSEFLRKCNFDFLGVFPNVWTSPPIQRNYYLSSCFDFVLHSVGIVVERDCVKESRVLDNVSLMSKWIHGMLFVPSSKEISYVLHSLLLN